MLLCQLETSKVLIFSAEFDQNDRDLTGVFCGQTYPYRGAFEGHEILGARVDSTDEYVRVLPLRGEVLGGHQRQPASR